MVHPTSGPFDRTSHSFEIVEKTGGTLTRVEVNRITPEEENAEEGNSQEENIRRNEGNSDLLTQETTISISPPRSPSTMPLEWTAAAKLDQMRRTSKALDQREVIGPSSRFDTGKVLQERLRQRKKFSEIHHQSVVHRDYPSLCAGDRDFKPTGFTSRSEEDQILSSPQMKSSCSDIPISTSVAQGEPAVLKRRHTSSTSSAALLRPASHVDFVQSNRKAVLASSLSKQSNSKISPLAHLNANIPSSSASSSASMPLSSSLNERNFQQEQQESPLQPPPSVESASKISKLSGGISSCHILQNPQIEESEKTSTSPPHNLFFSSEGNHIRMDFSNLTLGESNPDRKKISCCSAAWSDSSVSNKTAGLILVENQQSRSPEFEVAANQRQVRPPHLDGTTTASLAKRASMRVSSPSKTSTLSEQKVRTASSKGDEVQPPVLHKPTLPVPIVPCHFNQHVRTHPSDPLQIQSHPKNRSNIEKTAMAMEQQLRSCDLESSVALTAPTSNFPAPLPELIVDSTDVCSYRSPLKPLTKALAVTSSHATPVRSIQSGKIFRLNMNVKASSDRSGVCPRLLSRSSSMQRLAAPPMMSDARNPVELPLRHKPRALEGVSLSLKQQGWPVDHSYHHQHQAEKAEWRQECDAFKRLVLIVDQTRRIDSQIAFGRIPEIPEIRNLKVCLQSPSTRKDTQEVQQFSREEITFQLSESDARESCVVDDPVVDEVKNPYHGDDLRVPNSEKNAPTVDSFQETQRPPRSPSSFIISPALSTEALNSCSNRKSHAFCVIKTAKRVEKGNQLLLDNLEKGISLSSERRESEDDFEGSVNLSCERSFLAVHSQEEPLDPEFEQRQKESSPCVESFSSLGDENSVPMTCVISAPVFQEDSEANSHALGKETSSLPPHQPGSQRTRDAFSFSLDHHTTENEGEEHLLSPLPPSLDLRNMTSSTSPVINDHSSLLARYCGHDSPDDEVTSTAPFYPSSTRVRSTSPLNGRNADEEDDDERDQTRLLMMNSEFLSKNQFSQLARFELNLDSSLLRSKASTTILIRGRQDSQPMGTPCGVCKNDSDANDENHEDVLKTFFFSDEIHSRPKSSPAALPMELVDSNFSSKTIKATRHVNPLFKKDT
eukprot:GDKJ01016695.1.p1 GENE.GDKJ01016695.1~~GDKJ01016695.1.p1  ORF type:complete len:1119 (-),score=264.85 GDKJ01016695.1:66-3422(-)